MIYIFLLLFTIALAMLPSRESFAQPQIDSVQFDIKDIVVFDTSAHAYSDSFSLSVKSETIISDTNVFVTNVAFTSTFAPIIVAKVKFLSDSLSNLIDTFSYYEETPIAPFPPDDIKYFHLSNVTMTNTPSLMEIDLNQQDILAGKFDYFLRLVDYSPGAHVDVWTYQYLQTIPTSHVRITFFKHVPTTSITALTKNISSVIFYPNPASNSINISEENINSVTIFDFLGREVLNKKLSSSQNLDISSVPPGIYYLRAGSQMQKFVIQR